MNTFLKQSIIGTSTLVLLILGSCKKFVDINTNPNAATSSQASFVFSGALGTTYRNATGASQHIVPSTWTGMQGHSTSFTGGGAEKTYSITNSDFNGYTGPFDNLQDYQYIKEHADGDGTPWLKGPAEVMSCLVYQNLVDMNGDVPYTEALQGAAFVTPHYTGDNGKTIYEDLVVRLDAAMTAMAGETWPTDAAVTVFDIMFQGNRDNWIRFANTIKLRILMRQSFMPGRAAYIQTNIQNTIARGYIIANVLVQPGYQIVAGKLNPFYSSYGFNELGNIVSNHQYRKMGAVILNWLKTSNTTNVAPPISSPAATVNADTFRLQGLAWPAGTQITAPSATLSNYIGIPMGVGSGYATASSSAIGPIQIQQGQGGRAALFMLLAEAYFLQAEAKERYPALVFAGGTSQQLYEAGILSHFRTIAGVATIPNSGAVANAGDPFAIRYIARTIDNVGWTSSTDKIRAILIQKWVSLTNINGLEAWSEYRKSSGSASEGVPSKVRTLATTTNPEPVRFLIPLAEVQANGANVPPNVTVATKIFWDVN